MKNVLWLVSWYPNRLDKFDGDFIQRHARAVSLYCRVYVLCIKKDESLKPNSINKEISATGNLTEEIIYYNSVKTGIGFIDRLISFQQYRKHYRKAISAYIKLNKIPCLVHVHVAMKAGIAARWVKQKFGVPYIISEHWTAWLKEADHRVEAQSYLFKRMLAKVISGASDLSVVSDHLGRSIQHYFPGLPYRVIPNVVDTGIFYPAGKEEVKVTRFIHVSSMNYQKNTEAIIRALKLLPAAVPVELELYGPVKPAILELIASLSLQQVVTCKTEVSQPVLAQAMQQANALILYSRFETFGCVLIEAHACGIPVIVSNLSVFQEIVKEGVNGIFAEGENDEALANKMLWFIANKDKFNTQLIAAETARKFAFHPVGSQFIAWYGQIK